MSYDVIGKKTGTVYGTFPNRLRACLYRDEFIPTDFVADLTVVPHAESEGVEAWGVFNPQDEFCSANYHKDLAEKEVARGDGNYIVPGRFVPETGATGADEKQDKTCCWDEHVIKPGDTECGGCCAQPAGDTERVDEDPELIIQEYAELNELGEVQDGPTDERLSNDTHWRLVKYGPWKKLPRPVQPKPSAEELVHNELKRTVGKNYDMRAADLVAALREAGYLEGER